MTATLALLVLLAGSVVIVRLASVILRLTGLPDHVARFQSISALTGAGFTTTESEAIVNFPIRRKVIVALMLLGNLGLVSVAATVIVTLAESLGDTDRMMVQIAQMGGAVAVIAFFTMSKTLDRIMCGLAERFLRRFVNKRADQFNTLLALGPDHCVAAHIYRGHHVISAYELLDDVRGISILAVMGLEHHVGHLDQSEARIGPRETVICFASIDDHRRFAERLNALS